MSSEWDRQGFRRAYAVAGGSPNSARSYVTYLNRADRVLDGLDAAMEKRGGGALIAYAAGLPVALWGDMRNRRDSLSALRRFVALWPFASEPLPPVVLDDPEDARTAIDPKQIALLLGEAKSLAARYYRLTGKPLGMTGEIAEMEAAARLGLDLCPPRTAWYDAIDQQTGSKVQIKGKAVDPRHRYRGMCSAIRCSDALDEIVLVLLDRTTSEPLEMWRAHQREVVRRIEGLSSNRRKTGGVLAVTQFKSVAALVWQAA